MICDYLLENGYDEFKNLKNEIENTLEIIINDIYDDDTTNLLIDDVENILKEYPSQINMKIFNGKNMVEIAKHTRYKKLNSLLMKYRDKYGDNSIINTYVSMSSQTSFSNISSISSSNNSLKLSTNDLSPTTKNGNSTILPPLSSPSPLPSPLPQSQSHLKLKPL
eukprot:jgi/Orpsp1_1/1178105/evm.model.c7180000064054.2